MNKTVAHLPDHKQTEEHKRLFELLKRAYIDARYNMKEYHITKGDLEYLSHKVLQLKQLTEEICQEKIAQIGEDAANAGP
ncbi:hypothetical protein [Allomuricauda sp.]|uniref:hypothetical protein n=1 Tax=Flagellimonas sp. TaxID=2058762 RepID=UPI0025CDFB67|nr:hypothetical protein [Allomuricauda sp.]